MNKEEIEDCIISSGATITEYPFSAVKAVTVEVNNSLHVGISRSLSESEKKAGLAHELGHIKKGGLYKINTPPLLKQKAECLADRYAAEILASPEDVRKALMDGCQTVWELAERFDLPCEVMAGIITSYQCRMVI